MDIVVGGGKFGIKAVEFLIKQHREFVVLDRNPECEVLKRFGAGIELINEGAGKLYEIAQRVKPEWIFPTAPVHVAAEALKDLFEPWNEVIDCILSGIPQKLVVAVGYGGIVLSYNRDGICLENCNSPDVCPITKLKRPCPMFELIRFAYPKALVLISYQLAPGLGAIKGSEFIEVIEKAKESDRVVIATACKCHGVITALKKKGSP
ncbi:MAG: hypothetical protein QXP46_05930 [Archaeoglobaceae archaeon]